MKNKAAVVGWWPCEPVTRRCPSLLAWLLSMLDPGAWGRWAVMGSHGVRGSSRGRAWQDDAAAPACAQVKKGAKKENAATRYRTWPQTVPMQMRVSSVEQTCSLSRLVVKLGCVSSARPAGLIIAGER